MASSCISVKIFFCTTTLSLWRCANCPHVCQLRWAKAIAILILAVCVQRPWHRSRLSLLFMHSSQITFICSVVLSVSDSFCKLTRVPSKLLLQTLRDVSPLAGDAIGFERLLGAMVSNLDSRQKWAASLSWRSKDHKPQRAKTLNCKQKTNCPSICVHILHVLHRSAGRLATGVFAERLSKHQRFVLSSEIYFGRYGLWVDNDAH